MYKQILIFTLTLQQKNLNKKWKDFIWSCWADNFAYKICFLDLNHMDNFYWQELPNPCTRFSIHQNMFSEIFFTLSWYRAVNQNGSQADMHAFLVYVNLDGATLVNFYYIMLNLENSDHISKSIQNKNNINISQNQKNLMDQISFNLYLWLTSWESRNLYQ